MADGDRVAELEAENARLRDVIARLTSRIAELEAKLGENSANTSKPPSTDTNSQRDKQKQSRAERRREARRQGKQPGAEGRNLSQVATATANRYRDTRSSRRVMGATTASVRATRSAVDDGRQPSSRRHIRRARHQGKPFEPGPAPWRQRRRARRRARKAASA